MDDGVSVGLLSRGPSAWDPRRECVPCLRGGRGTRALTASRRRGGGHGGLGFPKGVPVPGGVVVCVPRLQRRCVVQLLQVAELACAFRRAVEKAQPAASAHPGDHDVEGFQVQVRRERARRDAED